MARTGILHVLSASLVSVATAITLATTPVASAEPAPIPGHTIVQVVLNIPYGQSMWQQALAQPGHLGPIMVFYQRALACGGFNVGLEFQDLASEAWQPGNIINGAFVAPFEQVAAFRMHFTQTVFTMATCHILVNDTDDSTPPSPAPTTKTLVGVVEFPGGFVEHQSLTLTSPVTTARMEIVIPDYCNGLQLLGASTFTKDVAISGHLDANARPAEFRLPEPKLVDRLDLSIIAPKDRTCELPVYAYVPSQGHPANLEPAGFAAD